MNIYIYEYIWSQYCVSLEYTESERPWINLQLVRRLYNLILQISLMKR